VPIRKVHIAAGVRAKNYIVWEEREGDDEDFTSNKGRLVRTGYRPSQKNVLEKARRKLR